LPDPAITGAKATPAAPVSSGASPSGCAISAVLCGDFSAFGSTTAGGAGADPSFLFRREALAISSSDRKMGRHSQGPTAA
jgi:hypothetical protein